MSRSAQQKWNEKNPEVVRKANKEFYQKHKQIKIEVSKEDHPDLIQWYEQLDKEGKKKLRAKIESQIIDFLYRQKDKSTK